MRFLYVIPPIPSSPLLHRSHSEIDTDSQHTGLATEKDRNTHFHQHVNANTDITKRQPYLEWKINPRFMELCRLALYKNCDMERTFRGSVNHPDLLPRASPFRKCIQCGFGTCHPEPPAPEERIRGKLISHHAHHRGSIQQTSDILPQKQVRDPHVLRIMHRTSQG
jgi:hypothetical protein